MQWNQHVYSLAYNSGIQLFPKLYELYLVASMLHCCALRSSRFYGDGSARHAQTHTRNVSFKFFVLYARTSLRKNNVLHQVFEYGIACQLNFTVKSPL